MTKTKIAILVLLCFVTRNGFAQTCPHLGQNPASAFPICGTAIFHQETVDSCPGSTIPVNCSQAIYKDKNPFWYKFTCYQSGLLSFDIIPLNLSDDYDWQLFDITGKTPNSVYTNATFISGNWSGTTGKTGAGTAFNGNLQCASIPTDNVPTYNQQPSLIKDHIYMLLVSHYTSNNQSGYNLSFGGTAVITDTVKPKMQSIKARCNGIKISLLLNKKMKCRSVDSDGSDFIIWPAISPIVSAIGVGCSNSFDTDSVELTLGNALPPGNYKITVRPHENLLDNCDNFIQANDTLEFTLFPLVETPMDSLTKVGCAPGVLNLVFKDQIQCNSIAADGSDFIIRGSADVIVTGAAGVCNADGLTNIIQVKLATPIQQTGTFIIQLKAGSDGSSIINECGKETTPGAALPFNTTDTVSALFTPNIHYGCVADTIFYSHNGNNGANTWLWNFDDSISSTIKDPFIIYPVFGQKQASLIVGNGTCSDTATTVVFLDNAINALFESTPVVCPGDPATFIDQSTGSLNNAWFWDFGNGNVSTQQTPSKQFYSTYTNIHDVPVQLIVTNTIGCRDTAINIIRVAGNCYIAVPKAFTPNGDGLNDYLYPTNAYKAKDLLFSVYNRAGQKIFETHDWTNKWDGTFKGNPQDAGSYVWMLSYTNIDSGQKIQQKGSTVLIR